MYTLQHKVIMNEKTILCNLIFVCLLFVFFLSLLMIYGPDLIYIMILLVTIWVILYVCCNDMCHKIEQHSQINQKPLQKKKETINEEEKIKEIEINKQKILII